MNTSNNNLSDPALSDRYFLSINGAVNGPFRQSELADHARTDALVWHVGQAEWSPWSVLPTTAVKELPMSDAITGNRQSLGEPQKSPAEIARNAASLPVRSVVASRQVAVARQELGGVYRAIGQAVIDQSMPLAEDATSKLRQDGAAVVAQIAGVDEVIAKEQHVLDRAEPTSAAAKQHQTKIADQRKERSLLLTRLRESQFNLGKLAQDDPNVQELLPDLRDRLARTRATLTEATERHEALRSERREAGSRIRLTLLKAGGVVLTLIGLLVGRVVMKVITDEFQKSRASRHEVEPTPTTQPVSASGVDEVATVSLLPPRVEPGLTRAQLRLASAVVVTSFKAYPNIEKAYSGSAAALSVLEDGSLQLITNRHVLALDELMAAKQGDKLWISEYTVQVKFPSGRVCPVRKIRPEGAGLDLALLEIEAGTLQAGVDYVFMTRPSDLPDIQPGDDVVAVGTPLGEAHLENTQTFGHVSGIRKHADGRVTTNYIQIDAAINHGNSGGPLFLKVGNRHLWAGINTLAGSPQQGVQGLNFAIEARQAMSLRYFSYDANAAGVAALLTNIHSFPASAYKP